MNVQKRRRTLPKVVVILLNFNGKNIQDGRQSLLDSCIQSLKKTRYAGWWKVIMADNGSTDGSFRHVRKHYPFVDVVRTVPNRGFGGGLNFGVEYAWKKYKPEYMFLLATDTKVLQEDWLERLVMVGEDRKGEVAVVAPAFVLPDGKVQRTGVVRFFSIRKGGHEFYEGKQPWEVQWLFFGGGMMLNMRIIRKLGLIDERYHPYYGEDHDLCYRYTKQGYKICIVPSVKLFHGKGKTTNQTPRWDDMRLRARGEALFVLSNLSWLHLGVSVMGRLKKIFFNFRKPQLLIPMLQGYYGGWRLSKEEPRIGFLKS